MKKIVITGATGQLGNQVLSFLLKKTDASAITAIARDTSKLSNYAELGVQVVQADYDDRESLVNAFSGNEILYFVSGNDVVKRHTQHENVVKAAIESGISHVVYTSFQRKNETESSPIAPIAGTHLQTEKWLKESGLNYTILKHALYSDVIPMFLGEGIIDRGMIYLPVSEGKAAFASRTDMAEAAANILTTDGHENKAYEISAGTSVSFGDIADSLSKISGKQISYISPTVDEFSKTLAEAGVPQDVIGFTLLFTEGIKQGEFDIPDPTLEKLLGRKPESVREYLKKLYSN